MINTVVEEIKQRIDNNIKALCELDEKYLKAYCPQDCPSGTSYTDYDAIHGGKREYRVEQYYKEKQRILALIELDKQLIVSIGLQVVDDKEYVNSLESNQQKVKYYRFVKCYTQSKTSEILGISERQVQRIEKEIKMSSLVSCTLDFR